MAFSNRNELVPVFEVTTTKEMSLLMLKAKKQECISRINKCKQEIEDLKMAKIAELEYQILYAEAELSKLLDHEKMIISSVDTQPTK